MRKILITACAVLAICITGCRTTEANYRAAYEKARDKQMDTGNSISTQGLKNELIPKDMKFNGVTLPVRTEPLGVTKDSGADQADLKLYNVVVATFRQRFNAFSMAKRLKESGYELPFVVHNRLGAYYVVAGSVSNPEAARLLLDRVKEDNTMSLKSPFPYVLRSAHLVR